MLIYFQNICGHQQALAMKKLVYHLHKHDFCLSVKGFKLPLG